MLKIVLWIMTLLRVFLIPPFLYVAYEAQSLARVGGDAGLPRLLALLLLGVMGGSDLVDGWMARRFKMTTQSGAVVDAISDKLVQVTLVAFFSLDVGPVFTALPFWFLLVVFGRDLALLVGWLMLRARYGSVRVVHRAHGRTASTLVFVVLAGAAFGAPVVWLTPLMILAAGVTATSATLYALEVVAQARARAG